MTKLEQLCLAFLVFILFLLLASLAPAPAQVFWFLRVGVPELGLAFFLASVPAALLLARKSPRVGACLLLAVAVLSLYPWISAALVARKLPAGMERAFSVAPLARSPLLLGDRSDAVSVTTETYKDKLQWDVYRPAKAPVRARILFVHGGSWRNGTRDDYPQLLSYLAARGFEVVSLTYSLAPENPYPAATDDIDDAIAKLSGDGLPLFLAGRSSGGHLALLAAYRNPVKVKGVIAFYPPTDMVWSYEHPSNPAVLNSREALEQFLGGPPTQRAEVYREASPLFEVTEAGPPTLLIHGGSDTLVYQRQSQRLAAVLMKKRVPHYLLELPWMEHGGDITIYGPSGRLSAWAIEDFIASLTSP